MLQLTALNSENKGRDSEDDSVRRSGNKDHLRSEMSFAHLEGRLSSLLAHKRTQVKNRVPNLTVFTLSFAKAFYAGAMASLLTRPGYRISLEEEALTPESYNPVDIAAHKYIDYLASQEALSDSEFQDSQNGTLTILQPSPSSSSPVEYLIDGLDIQDTTPYPPSSSIQTLGGKAKDENVACPILQATNSVDSTIIGALSIPRKRHLRETFAVNPRTRGQRFIPDDHKPPRSVAHVLPSSLEDFTNGPIWFGQTDEE